MARAFIYRNVIAGKGKGRQLEQAMGLVDVVQDRLKLEATQGAHRAEANLKIFQHGPEYDEEDRGHSFIDIESGDVDWHVVLNDDRGLGAAMNIEYGRKARYYKLKDNDAVVFGLGYHMEGTWVLHDAMKIGRTAAGVEMGADFD